MSEKILRALMQLFAIIANAETSENENAIEVVRSFLSELLSVELVQQYLGIYRNYLEEIQKASKKKDGSVKKLSLNSVKVLRICTDINKELTQKQKIVVLIRLIEFVTSEIGKSDLAIEFINNVAEGFKIEPDEYLCIKNFVISSEDKIHDMAKLLVVDGIPENKATEAKHIFCENLEGRILVLYVESINIYAFRYFGNSSIYLNGQVIKPFRVNIFNQGAALRNQKIHPIYYSDVVSTFLSSRSTSKIVFEVKHVDYFFNKTDQGLHDINLKEESGRLIGIMGGSGAGKSTLLKILNGLSLPTRGEVLINGINIHSGDSSIMGQIGYIPQDDLLIEDLTVFQNLFYSAKLSFGHITDDEITKRCNEVLTDLGLFDARNLKVGNPLEQTISGGQRKRLNIALELIREPGILFVDEPTSGLSSRDSENIMDLFKELALKGKLVFVVIHQPSSDIFKMFDKLYILDTGGFPIYYGNPVEAIVYFKTLSSQINAGESECITCGNVTPEEVFNIIDAKILDEYGNLTRERKTSPVEWNALFLKNYTPPLQNEKDGKIPPTDFSIPSLLSQFKTFVTRDVLSKLTNTQYIVISLFEAPVLACILAGLIRFHSSDTSKNVNYTFFSNENIPTYIFMSVIVAIFLGLMVSAEEIIRDQKIRKRESFLNLSKGSYLISKILIMFSISAVQMALFVAIGNSILNIKGMWMHYWLVLFSVCCFSNLLGLNISASFKSVVNIYILIPFLIIPQILLSGLVVKFNKLNPKIASQSEVPFVGQIMTSRWAFEALTVYQFKNNKYEKVFYPYDKWMSIAKFRKNDWIPEMRNILEECEDDYKTPNLNQKVSDNLLLLKNEISKQMDMLPQIQFTLIDSLNTPHFSESIVTKTSQYFNSINDYYTQLFNTYFGKKDQLIQSLTSTDSAKTAFDNLKYDYTNESLENLVKNSNDFTNIVEDDNHELIQNIDPVFADPIKSSIFGNAQFYAPTKRMFGQLFDTYSVNLCIIWSMSIFLAIALYFNALKGLIDLPSNIKWPFQLKGNGRRSKKKP